MLDKVEELKEKFILKEIWSLTINGAFQRAYVYSEIAKGDKKTTEKEIFKNKLRKFIEDISLSYVDELKDINLHYSKIASISAFSEDYGNLLMNNKLNFGISQKLLNLYLKYLWCLGKIKTPPHFPVDRQIQILLGDNNPTAWTNWQDNNVYDEVIDKAKTKRGNEKYGSIAELELELFLRL